MQSFRFLFLSITVFSFWGLLACKHDPFIQPTNSNTPDNPIATGFCDPDSVYFQNHILPILVSNCTESGCHNPIDRQEGVVLDSYQNLVSTVENATQNDLHENKLMRAVLETDLEDRMPPSPKPALSTMQIDLLKTWLGQGAQNNACDENFGGCDVNGVGFGAFIQPLIQTKCQGCHSGSNPQGNLKLTSYLEIQAIALNGKLYSTLTRSSNWMPKGGAKLDDCSLQKIQYWINLGAPQN